MLINLQLQTKPKIFAESKDLFIKINVKWNRIFNVMTFFETD